MLPVKPAQGIQFAAAGNLICWGRELIRRRRDTPAQLSRQRRRADLVAATGGPHLALEFFRIFYVTCIAMTWWFYLRKSFMAKQAPRRAETRV
jgi:hypothetical protein